MPTALTQRAIRRLEELGEGESRGSQRTLVGASQGSTTDHTHGSSAAVLIARLLRPPRGGSALGSSARSGADTAPSHRLAIASRAHASRAHASRSNDNGRSMRSGTNSITSSESDSQDDSAESVLSDLLGLILRLVCARAAGSSSGGSHATVRQSDAPILQSSLPVLRRAINILGSGDGSRRRDPVEERSSRPSRAACNYNTLALRSGNARSSSTVDQSRTASQTPVTRVLTRRTRRLRASSSMSDGAQINIYGGVRIYYT